MLIRFKKCIMIVCVGNNRRPWNRACRATNKSIGMPPFVRCVKLNRGVEIRKSRRRRSSSGAKKIEDPSVIKKSFIPYMLLCPIYFVIPVVVIW